MYHLALTMMKLICLFSAHSSFLLFITTSLAFHHPGEPSVSRNVETSLVLQLNIIYRSISSDWPQHFSMLGPINFSSKGPTQITFGILSSN